MILTFYIIAHEVLLPSEALTALKSPLSLILKLLAYAYKTARLITVARNANTARSSNTFNNGRRKGSFTTLTTNGLLTATSTTSIENVTSKITLVLKLTSKLIRSLRVKKSEKRTHVILRKPTAESDHF